MYSSRPISLKFYYARPNLVGVPPQGSVESHFHLDHSFLSTLLDKVPPVEHLHVVGEQSQAITRSYKPCGFRVFAV